MEIPWKISPVILYKIPWDIKPGTVILQDRPISIMSTVYKHNLPNKIL